MLFAKTKICFLLCMDKEETLELERSEPHLGRSSH